MSKRKTDRAYAALNKQDGAADWSAAEVFQFLLGEGLSEDEARDLTRDCRPDEDFETRR